METVTVNAKALFRVLMALNGPSHYIAELQVTRDNGRGLFQDNPIDILCQEYNEAVESYNKLHSERT